MSAQSLEEKLTTSALRFLSFRARSQKELEDFLLRKLKFYSPIISNSSNLIEKIIEGLKRSGLVDDLSFAKNWVDSRIRIHAKSLTVIRQELFQKGINKDIIEEVLSKIDSSFEESKAVMLVNKKLKTFSGLELEKRQKKLIGFLVRRGFGWDLSRRVVENLTK